MMTKVNIQGFMTTTQASEASGLTAHRIGCLVRAGEIDAMKSGNTLLVDATSLQAYAKANKGRGRPMDARTAYGALWLLSGLDADWLSYAQARRLRIRLRSCSAEELSWQLRKRAQTRRYRASGSFLTGISDSLVLSGASSGLLGDFGLLKTDGTVEGYCREEDIGRLEKNFFLAKDTHGNVAARVASWLPEAPDGEMPIAVVAADLAQSLDAREREAGFDILRRLLDEHREV